MQKSCCFLHVDIVNMSVYNVNDGHKHKLVMNTSFSRLCSFIQSGVLYQQAVGTVWDWRNKLG